MFKSLLKAAGQAEPTSVQLERRSDGRDGAYVLQIGDVKTEIEIHDEGDGSGWIRIHGVIHRFCTAASDGKAQVWLDGTVHAFEAVESGARRAAVDAAAAGPAGNAITAPMPGTILKLLVKPGDSFQAHQALVVMESMKMEMTLSAPRDGRVKEISCGAGELVEMGKVLLKMEPI
ncbi:MAG: hypothetical protein IPK83_08275 [Planctomycetes bacterium]|nr:hypothetical protein [Planctomycetota bacterium]